MKRDPLGLICMLLIRMPLIPVLLAWGFVCLVWQVQNPKANPITCLTYFNDVIHLRKLEKFQ